MLTVDDPHRFRRSRDLGCYIGLRPGRRNSGQSQPQLHISKEGNRYLRTLLVQGAHYILGPFGEDSDLRRWGLKLAERGGSNAKKRAVVAVARKLAVLLHKLWVSGEVYEPLRNHRKENAQRHSPRIAAAENEFRQDPSPSSGDCGKLLDPTSLGIRGDEVEIQVDSTH